MKTAIRCSRETEKGDTKSGYDVKRPLPSGLEWPEKPNSSRLGEQWREMRTVLLLSKANAKIKASMVTPYCFLLLFLEHTCERFPSLRQPPPPPKQNNNHQTTRTTNKNENKTKQKTTKQTPTPPPNKTPPTKNSHLEGWIRTLTYLPRNNMSWTSPCTQRHQSQKSVCI